MSDPLVVRVPIPERVGRGCEMNPDGTPRCTAGVLRQAGLKAAYSLIAQENDSIKDDTARRAYCIEQVRKHGGIPVDSDGREIE